MTVNTREDIKLSNAQIAWRAAQDIKDGAYVNLGIGFPEMVARYQPEGREAISIRKTASSTSARLRPLAKRTGT